MCYSRGQLILNKINSMQQGRENLIAPITDPLTSRAESKSSEKKQDPKEITTKFVLEYQINVLQVINEALDLGYLNTQMIGKVMLLAGMLIYGETADKAFMPNNPLLNFIKSVLEQESLIPNFKKLMLLAVCSLKIIGSLRSNLQMMMLLKLFRYYASSPKSTAEIIKTIFNVLSLSDTTTRIYKGANKAGAAQHKQQGPNPQNQNYTKNKIEPVSSGTPHMQAHSIPDVIRDLFAAPINPLEVQLNESRPKGAGFDTLKPMDRSSGDSTAYNEEVAREIAQFVSNTFPLNLTLLETIFNISKRDLEVYTSKGSQGKNIGNVAYIGGQTDILKLDQQIRLTVLEVVTGFYNQRYNILKSLMNVEVIYGDEERRIYKVMTDNKSENSLSIDNLTTQISILMAMDPRMGSFAREGKQSKLYHDYQAKLDRVIHLLESLISDMRSKFNTKLNFKKTQNLFKNKGYHEQLFRLFELQFVPELHLGLFTKITEFFFHFSNYNSQNKKLLLPNISIFIELISKGVDTSALVSNICQIVHDSKTNAKIVDYIFNKINQIVSSDKVKMVLNLRNSRKNKRYVIDEATVVQLGHLVSFKNILSGMIFDDQNKRREETQRKVIFCLINSKELVKVYEFKYFNEIKGLITKEKAKDEHHRRFYSFYAAYLSLLAELSSEFRMGIDQARRLVTKEQIMEILSSESTPLYFKKHFLKCFHHIFLPKEKEHSGWMKDHKMLEDLFNLIINKDLPLSACYLEYLVPKDQRQPKEETMDSPTHNGAKLPDLLKKGAERKKVVYNTNTEEVMIADGMEFWDYLISKQPIDGTKYGLLYFIHYVLRAFNTGEIVNENNEFANARMETKKSLRELNDELDRLEKSYPKLDLSDLRIMICECMDLLPDEQVPKAGTNFSIMGNPLGKQQHIIHKEPVVSGSTGEAPNRNKDAVPKIVDSELKNMGSEEIAEKCAINVSIHIRRYLIHRRIGFEDLFNLLVLTGSANYLKNAKEILGIDELDKTLEVLVACEVRKVRGDTSLADYDTLMKEANTIIDFARMLIYLEDTKLLVYQSLNKASYFPNKLKEKVDEKYKPNKLMGATFKNSDSLKAPFQRFVTDYCDRYLSNGEYDNELEFWVGEVGRKITKPLTDDEPLAFLRSLQKIFVQYDDRLFLLRTLKLVLKKVCPEGLDGNSSMEGQVEVSRYHRIQNIFNNAEVPILCLSVINERSDPVVVDEACHVLCYLLKLGNSLVQSSVFQTLEDNLFTQTFFTYIKERLDTALHLINDERSKPLNQRSILEMENKLLIQRFRGITYQSMIINILQVLKYFCDNCCLKFQNFLRNQITAKLKFNLHTINMLECVSDFLVRLVKEDRNLIFGHFSQLVEVILNVLTEFVLGPCEPNQQILIENKKLLDVINTVLEVKLNEQIDSMDGRGITVPAKIKILHQTAIFLESLVTGNDKSRLLSVLLEGISRTHLREQLIVIYILKVRRQKNLLFLDSYCHLVESEGTDGASDSQGHDDLDQPPGTYPSIMMDQTGSQNAESRPPSIAGAKPIASAPSRATGSCTQEHCKEGKIAYFDLMLVNTSFKLFLIVKQLEDRLQGNKSLETLGLQKVEEKPSFEQQRLKGASLLKLDDYNPGPDKLKYLNENKINQAQNRANLQKAGQNGPSSSNKRASPYAEGPDIPAEEVGLKDAKILDAIRSAEDDSMRDGLVLASDNATYEYRQKFDQSRALITTAPLITDTMNRNKVGDTDPQLLTEFYDNERKIYFNEARKFLSSYVASVEILFNGTIEKVHFQIPYCCKFISDNIKRSIIWDVNRSSDQERVESFYFKVRYYELEMKRRQSLSAWKFLYFLTKNWRIVKYLNYALILVLNIFMMVYFKHEFLSSSDSSEDFTPTRTVDIMRQSVEALLPAAAERFTFRVVSYVQVVLSFLVLVFCAFERLPKHLYKPSKNDYYIREKEKLKNQKFDDGLHSRIQKNEDERNDSISTQNSFFEMLLTTCLDFTNVYNIVLFGISILGVFGYYLLYSILLFDVLKLSRTMTRITLALYKNLKLFGLTLLLALFILYFYSVIGFNYFPRDYLHGSDMVYKNYCHTLLDCFISTANNGLRARGGIGEALGSQYREAGDFWQRVAFDITFFLVIMVLLLNVIFGVIIDSFSAMREELNRLSEDVENKCYICGLQKFELDTKGEGWYRHIFESHNVYNYLYFLIYIEKKDMGDCSGVEKYVKELCMRNSASFFPIGRSLSIEKPRKLI